MMLVIGIDIGMSGALAAVRKDAAVSVKDLGVLHLPNGHNRLDGGVLYQDLRALVDPEQHVLVVAEDIRPRPEGNAGRHGNTMHSQGSLMRSRGIVECCCDILCLRVEWVQPQAWKRSYGLTGQKKEASRQTALVLMPEMADRLTRKRDEGRAEALLIARYGLQRFA